MANYTKSTNFATKDSLTSGNPLKIVKGTEIDTEFNNIQTAIATKSDSGSTLAVGNGGTGATTAAGARASLLPAFASNVGKVLAVNSSATDVEFIAAGGSGTVTSVGGTGTVNGITLTGTVTASGNLTLGGTLSGVSLTSQVSGTLPIANGGTGSTSTAYCSLTSNVSGTLPVANGGTGSTSGVPASIVQAGTFGTGTNYLFNSGSSVAFGATNPSPTLWRMYVRTVDGNPAIVADRGSNVFSNSIVCNDDLVSSSTTRPYITFTNNGTGLASISTTDGATIVYGTGSDYRLKTNVQPLVNSTIKVKALKPCSYNWIKAPEVSGQGFLAHELAEVVPQAVVGEKDALYPDGSINIQQVDLSYVVPLLTSALQEALVRIEALEVRITALESQ